MKIPRKRVLFPRHFITMYISAAASGLQFNFVTLRCKLQTFFRLQPTEETWHLHALVEKDTPFRFLGLMTAGCPMALLSSSYNHWFSNSVCTWNKKYHGNIRMAGCSSLYSSFLLSSLCHCVFLVHPRLSSFTRHTTTPELVHHWYVCNN